MTPAEERAAIAAAYRARLNLSNEDARIVLRDLARTCHVDSTTHVPNDSDATAFREGKRAVFIYVASLIGLPLLPEG